MWLDPASAARGAAGDRGLLRELGARLGIPPAAAISSKLDPAGAVDRRERRPNLAAPLADRCDHHARLSALRLHDRVREDQPLVVYGSSSVGHTTPAAPLVRAVLTARRSATGETVYTPTMTTSGGRPLSQWTEDQINASLEANAPHIVFSMNDLAT
jgi:3-deoxy-D-manno-octulosonic-acid transferase